MNHPADPPIADPTASIALKHDRLQAALAIPNGARFYRCALQVNPWSYVTTHVKEKPAFVDEAAYNAAMVAACLDARIDVVGVTDHFAITQSRPLIDAFEEAGIRVFPGFEAKTQQGIHVLCVFDPGHPLDHIKAAIIQCGLMGEGGGSPVGDCDLPTLLRNAREKWGAECIAAHVTQSGGLLVALQGTARASAWKERDLLAAAIPGPLSEMDQKFKAILENKSPEYERAHPLALVNASDVSSPDDFKKPGSWCWIKMSSISVEGLRQAFLDWESRVRFAAEAPDEPPRTELKAITWDGGFLGDVAVHLNPNLNVFIGGRGTGKSTLVESIRYVLDRQPLGDDAARAHQGIVQKVLKAGTKVSLLVRSSHPTQRDFIVERTVPNPPVVKDPMGTVTTLTTRDVVPIVDIFGQHEISEVAKNPEKRTQLLERFADQSPERPIRKQKARRELEKSRTRILETRRELQDVLDRLSALPGLEEKHQRYQAAGLEDKLKDKTLLEREERVLRTASARLEPFDDALSSLESLLPIDRVFATSTALEALPGKDALSPLLDILATFEERMRETESSLAQALSDARERIDGVRQQWGGRKKSADAAYERLLRELQKTKVDATEFVELKRQLEDMRPLKEREASLRSQLKELDAQRRTLLDEWQSLVSEEARALEQAAKQVTKRLKPLVKVDVAGAGNRQALRDALASVKGLRSDATGSLLSAKELSPLDLAATCRQGAESLSKKYGLSSAMAERICGGGESLFLALEEVELRPTTSLSLNVTPDADEPNWQSLEDLSTGQKATAILLLLLLDEEAPLIVDQPEDDLDNRFIIEGVVRRMRDAKRKRQFIFATHNANIPVLGDAELIGGLTPTGEDRAHIASGDLGSIDDTRVQELVENILEGGRAAFELRRRKYGFR